MIVVRTQCLNVWRNLAVEEALLDRFSAEAQPLLFLWRSAHAVVIGKNQNPWREANIPLMNDDGCALARRISGGGAVYHDEGNLNYTFIVDRRHYKGSRVFAVVLAALHTLGFHAARMGRTSIGVDGRKVSGNAFCLRRGAALHHGTLLVSSDRARMGRYLRSGTSAIRSRAIASQPAETVNLRELQPDIGIGNVEAALVQSAAAEFGAMAESRGDDWLEAVVRKDDCGRMASWDWLYGQTPSFELDIERTLAGLSARLYANVTDGRIGEARATLRDPSSGAVALESRLQGVRFDVAEIAERLRPVAAALQEGLEYAMARAFVTA